MANQVTVPRRGSVACWRNTSLAALLSEWHWLASAVVPVPPHRPQGFGGCVMAFFEWFLRLARVMLVRRLISSCFSAIRQHRDDVALKAYRIVSTCAFI